MAFRIFLVLRVERGCASRFSFSGLLRIVMCEGGRDWRTEEGESGCASRFSLSRSLRMVMCAGGRDWRTEGDDGCELMIEGSDRALAGLLRMLRGHGDTGESEGVRYMVDKGLGVTFS
jgi:hypothetical protein